MEKIKSLKDIEIPDDRQLIFRLVNLETGQERKRTIEDIHMGADELTLSDTVPEKIRSHFATAQNLLVYSWYYYPFGVTAQFLALVTVELALKERFKSKDRFANLVRRAVAEGFIKEEGFSHLAYEKEKLARYGIEIDESFGVEYCKSLVESMPYLRNELAHGSSMLHNRGLSWVRVCAEFIEQLYAHS